MKLGEGVTSSGYRLDDLEAARRIVQAVADQLSLDAEGPTEDRLNKLIRLSADACGVSTFEWSMSLMSADNFADPCARLTVRVGKAEASARLERVDLQAMKTTSAQAWRDELNDAMNTAKAVFGEEGR